MAYLANKNKTLHPAKAGCILVAKLFPRRWGNGFFSKMALDHTKFNFLMRHNHCGYKDNHKAIMPTINAATDITLVTPHQIHSRALTLRALRLSSK